MEETEQCQRPKGNIVRSNIHVTGNPPRKKETETEKKF